MCLSHKRLLVFITLSLFLHIIWLTGQSDYRIYIPEQPGSLMAIRLNEQQAPSQKKPVAQNKQTGSSPAIQKQVSRQTADRRSARQNQISNASVLTEIRQKLTRHFVYPVMARRMGWQGQVLLGFRVDDTGSIQHIHVKQSSGYAILDDSAIAALNKLGKVGINETGFLNRSWQLEIPVIYRLEG